MDKLKIGKRFIKRISENDIESVEIDLRESDGALVAITHTIADERVSPEEYCRYCKRGMQR